MLKGLALRQGFLAANIVLAVILAVLAVLLVRELFRAGVQPGPVSQPNVKAALAPLKLAEVRNRAAYDPILQRGLFGAAGSYDPSKKPSKPAPAAEPTQTAEETRLPLRLFGTTFRPESHERAAAIIEVREGAPRTNTYYPEEEVISNVFLKEVRRAEVILDNRRTNRLERLALEREENPGAGARARTPVARTVQRVTPRSAVTQQRPTLITLDREKITERLEEEYARVASRLNVRVVRDEKGEVQGITTDNIEQYDLAKELGFQNGDVLVSVNNEPVDSRESAVEVIQKYRDQNASLFRIGVLRNGQTQYINYRVR